MNRQRRVFIPRNTSEKKVLDDLRSMPHVRSVISEYGEVPSCRNFKLLRVHASENHYYDGASRLNLRHLDVKVRSMSSFFSSINLHWNSHTLIVSCTNKFTAPIEIWKMPQFRHIEFVTIAEGSMFLPGPPSDGVVMQNLQILKGLENFKFSKGMVERIPNIRQLAMPYSGGEGIDDEDYYCLNNIQRLCKLESLDVSLSTSFRKVESINRFSFPHSLKKLNLWVTHDFEWDDMLENIGSLPLLEKLKLWNGCFRGGKWEVVEGQFPCLKFLGIYSCHVLKYWTMEEENSIFPRLEHLCLYDLDGLEEIPSKIGDIATLQKIELLCCSASAVKSAKVIVEEQVELQGEELPFHVKVVLASHDEELLSLAGPNLEVRL